MLQWWMCKYWYHSSSSCVLEVSNSRPLYKSLCLVIEIIMPHWKKCFSHSGILYSVHHLINQDTWATRACFPYLMIYPLWSDMSLSANYIKLIEKIIELSRRKIPNCTFSEFPLLLDGLKIWDESSFFVYHYYIGS